MSKIKSTRSSKPKQENNVQTAVVSAIRKIFYVPEAIVGKAGDKKQLRLERFYQPGKNRTALFLAEEDNGSLMEVLEFAEPRRSWLIDNQVCSNGRIYITTPVDTTFLALHPLRKHCTQKAMAMDNIYDEQEPGAHRLLTKFTRTEHLQSIADVKSVGDMNFYKYNHDRTLAWLSLKTQKVITALKKAGVHCGHSALSQNYMRSEKNKEEENVVNDMDYTRVACDIVGSYLDLELHEELIRYLEIPNEIEALVDEKAATQKRKSQQNLKSNDSKKIKLNNELSASEKLKNSGLLDSSVDDVKETIPSTKPTPLKERVLSAKEKSFAKGAKGTKSIASFFKKV